MAPPPSPILTREANHAGPGFSEDDPSVFPASPVAFPRALLDAILNKPGFGPWLRLQRGAFL